MKNIVVKILVSLVVFYHIGLTVSAADTQVFDDGSSITTATYDDGSTMTTTTDTEGSSTVSSTDATVDKPKIIMVGTTENKIGVNCKCDAVGNKGNGTEQCEGPKVSHHYACEVGVGFSQFQMFFARIIRIVINITILLGVLAVVGLGIAWSLAGGDDVKAKSSLKSWAINIIAGVVILFFFRYILMFLAPWIYN